LIGGEELDQFSEGLTSGDGFEVSELSGEFVIQLVDFGEVNEDVSESSEGSRSPVNLIRQISQERLEGDDSNTRNLIEFIDKISDGVKFNDDLFNLSSGRVKLQNSIEVNAGGFKNGVVEGLNLSFFDSFRKSEALGNGVDESGPHNFNLDLTSVEFSGGSEERDGGVGNNRTEDNLKDVSESFTSFSHSLGFNQFNEEDSLGNKVFRVHSDVISGLRELTVGEGMAESHEVLGADRSDVFREFFKSRLNDSGMFFVRSHDKLEESLNRVIRFG
jgi:hypothetical protein